MSRRSGITLIELLTVIAIIAILAGIAFPVIANAKNSAYRNSDISNMNQLRTALQLYKADQGGYPPALLGYATSYMGGAPNVNDIIPANELTSGLFPKRVPDLQTFRPSQNRGGGAGRLETQFTDAVWPNGLNVNGGPEFQKFGPSTAVQKITLGPGGCAVEPAYYYRLSGYDVAPFRDGGAERQELRYTLFWTGYGLPDDPCTQDRGSMNDNPRQMGYADPPEDTVVTWNTFFRPGTGVPARQKNDFVLFLGGNARAMDSQEVYNLAWQIKP